MNGTDAPALNAQRHGEEVDVVEIALLDGAGELQIAAENAGVVFQGHDDGLGQGDFGQRLFHRHAEHDVEHGEDAHHESIVGIFVGKRALGQQLHHAAAGDGGARDGRRSGIAGHGGEQQCEPAEQLLVAQNGGGMAERGDFGHQPETRGVDVAQQLEGQRRVALEHLLDLV